MSITGELSKAGHVLRSRTFDARRSFRSRQHPYRGCAGHGAQFDVFEASAELTQVFTRDPHGILLELSFHGE
jgi:hypothetical protein